MRNAVIVGGTGQIGLAAARRLLDEGWDVTLVSRNPPAPGLSTLPTGCRNVAADARDGESLSRAVGTRTDLLLSCVAFDERDAACLVRAGGAAGRIVAISSASVYRDEAGRTLDEAAGNGFPAFPVPLTEAHPTVAPGPETYSTRKVAMENALLNGAPCPVTILRPCAIHGPESKHAREWWFVKRLLDGRRAIPLAYRGASRFQTTAAAAIADAVVQAVNGGLPPVSNVCDADSPSVAAVGRAVMAALGIEADLVGLPDAASYPPRLGATPWSIPRPMVCASAASPAATYAEAVGPAVAWLADHVTGANWRERLPQLALYPGEQFDYEADERALRLPGAERLAP